METLIFKIKTTDGLCQYRPQRCAVPANICEYRQPRESRLCEEFEMELLNFRDKKNVKYNGCMPLMHGRYWRLKMPAGAGRYCWEWGRLHRQLCRFGCNLSQMLMAPVDSAESAEALSNLCTTIEWRYHRERPYEITIVISSVLFRREIITTTPIVQHIRLINHILNNQVSKCMIGLGIS